MRNPKEQAQELVDKFQKNFEFFHRDERGNTAFTEGKLTYPNQKQCAIICVDEIIRVSNTRQDFIRGTTDSFWDNVKKEIQAL